MIRHPDTTKEEYKSLDNSLELHHNGTLRYLTEQIYSQPYVHKAISVKHCSFLQQQLIRPTLITQRFLTDCLSDFITYLRSPRATQNFFVKRKKRLDFRNKLARRTLYNPSTWIARNRLKKILREAEENPLFSQETRGNRNEDSTGSRNSRQLIPRVWPVSPDLSSGCLPYRSH
ncbi:unnamed protein product [Xylocopa violacea]|uniref:Uncharacterized protein n=1 Tax=Xylocopa violacea TaxID=135666 RepID=A0ABP1NAA6_XYLVO